jgi:hypothetical protein
MKTAKTPTTAMPIQTQGGILIRTTLISFFQFPLCASGPILIRRLGGQDDALA